MLSFPMVEVLLPIPFGASSGASKDGRTVRALRNRGYITKVEWSHPLGTYTFRLTKLGAKLTRNLKFIPKELWKEVLS